MSEAYTEAHGDTRDERVLIMIEEMGVSVLSGALSTLIAAFFMFFAPNQFFVKFASFLFVTIALSCIYALVLFPAALAVFGPLGNAGSLYAWLGRMKDNILHEFAKSYMLSKEFLEREGPYARALRHAHHKHQREEKQQDEDEASDPPVEAAE